MTRVTSPAAVSVPEGFGPATLQLRVHASHAGAPLLGDRDYGGPTRWTLKSGKSVTLARIALHCARVTVEGLEAISSEIPETLRAWWAAAGGEDGAWGEVLG